MKIILTIEIEADSSHVTESELESHLGYIADTIQRQAENEGFEDYNRKISVSYDEQEDVNLSVRVKKETL